MKRIAILLLIGISHTVYAKTCTGRMINPVMDICWECMFPITIGAMPVVKGVRSDTDNPSNPVCVCPGKISLDWIISFL